MCGEFGGKGYSAELLAVLSGLILAGCVLDAGTSIPVSGLSAPTPDLTPPILRPAGEVVEVAFEEAFEVLRRIPLEENAEVLNVSIFASPDPDGILITDRLEKQVRLYDPEGRLIWHFGREGDGPGEFSTPRTAIRVGEHVVVVDSRRRLTKWSPRDGVVGVVNLPAYDVASISAVTDTHLVLTTRSLRPGLVLWNLADDREEMSFFEPPVPSDPRYASFTWGHSSVMEERILTSVSISDTLYIHDMQGDMIARLQLGIGNLLHPVPPEGLGVTVRMTEWASTGDMVLAAFWQDADTVVAWVRTGDSTPFDLKYALMVADISGGRTWVKNSPRLLMVHGGAFVFQDPDVIEGNMLMLARRR